MLYSDVVDEHAIVYKFYTYLLYIIVLMKMKLFSLS